MLNISYISKFLGTTKKMMKKKKCLFTAEPAENTENTESQRRFQVSGFRSLAYSHLTTLTSHLIPSRRLRALRALGGKQIQSFLQDERAVSAVIGFVLILGIVISASTIYFSSQVPEWTKDFESLHTDDVADDFAELKSLIDGIVLKKGESELAGGATPVKMSPDKVPILGMSPSGSNLIFNHQDEKIEIVVPTGGGGGAGAEPPWEQNVTTGFPYKEAYHVDNSSKEVTLARYAPEGDLRLDGDNIQLGDEYSYDQVIITNNSILSVSHVTGFLKIHANSISVDSSSKIIADRVGYPGGTADRTGFGPGPGTNGSSDGSGGGGAGYGASGGVGGGTNPGSGGTAYGDATSTSIEIGSGGGGGGSGSSGGVIGGSGGSGGGAIWLDAEIINITGNIFADGDYGLPGSQRNQDGGGGGGSGGGIMIKGRNVTISGTLSVKGGDGGDNKGGGGGGAGGRIKIFYENLTNGTENYHVSGGAATGDEGLPGGTGSIYHEKMSTYVSSITHYSSGYLVSEIYNTTSESTCYGEMTWNATLNNQSLVMKVRTDMFEDMRASPDWDYCPAVSNGSDVSGLSSVSDSHCYVQYCAELSTKDDTTTPVLHWVKINYTLSAESPTVANSSGSIKFNSNYLYYPNQEIVYEHGAVIKWQHEGGFMLQPPPINFTNKSGIPAIEISMIDLTGSNRSYSGATSTSLKNTYQSYNLHADSLKYHNLTINVTTAYPSVWERWFKEELKKTNLTIPHDYNVSVDDTTNTVSVEFYGYVGGVELYLEKTVVKVEI